jgi:hypothetical protein
MDIQDVVPSGGGSLRGPQAEPVATFTDTQFVHPDEYWHPLGGEFDSRAPSLSSDDEGATSQQAQAAQRDASPGRSGTDMGGRFDLQGTARMIRSSVRPGG